MTVSASYRCARQTTACGRSSRGRQSSPEPSTPTTWPSCQRAAWRPVAHSPLSASPGGADACASSSRSRWCWSSPSRSRRSGSGRSCRRPCCSSSPGSSLTELLDQLRPDDTLVVWRLDRLGRSIRHLIDQLQALGERGVGFRSLQEPLTPPRPAVGSCSTSSRH
ncbi:hypothetical protein DEJ23_15215 [Curtobacterium sp. MCSS17_008]|nr:hypothetical protein DEJ23_15215 [Curtobacterium sp. MCSS17_008]